MRPPASRDAEENLIRAKPAVHVEYTLHGAVATTSPLAGARVSISDMQTMSHGQTTGEDGTVVLKDEPAGLLPFSVSAPGHERISEYLRLTPGGDHDLGA